MAAGPKSNALNFIPQEVPAQNSAAVNTAADVNMNTLFNSGFCTKLWVGGAGNVALQLIGDTTPVTLTGVPAGTLLQNLQIAIVKSTANGTTATGLVAFM